MTEEGGMFTARDGLIDQPTLDPTRKVSASGIAGLLVVLVLVALSAFGIEVPGVVVETLPVSEAVTGLAMFVAAYFTRDRA